METRMIVQKDIIRIAAAAGLILLIPLFGNLFAAGWSWDVADFVIMGGLLFCTGLAIAFAIRKIAKPSLRVAAVAAIMLALLAIWIELAVGGVTQLINSLLDYL